MTRLTAFGHGGGVGGVRVAEAKTLSLALSTIRPRQTVHAFAKMVPSKTGGRVPRPRDGHFSAR